MTSNDGLSHVSQPTGKPSLPGRIVLVMQGGGALGSYQAGAYEALHEAGIEPERQRNNHGEQYDGQDLRYRRRGCCVGICE